MIKFAAAAAILAVTAKKYLIILETIDDLLDYVNRDEIKSHIDSHVYLGNRGTRNYSPVSQENHRPLSTEIVEGKLPHDLDGLFSRNGPNPIAEHQKKYYHWFDGHGHLHNLRIKDGEAFYTNGFIPTPRYTIEKKLGKQYFTNIGELKGISGLIKAIFISSKKPSKYNLSTLTTGQANTHSIMTGHNKFYACHEASLPFELELNDDGSIVRGVGYETFGNVLDYPVSAHPKTDPKSGQFIFHSYTLDPVLIKKFGSIKVGVYNPNKDNVELYRGIRSSENDHTSFAHDLMFTKNYIVVYDSSAHLDPMQIMNKTGDFITWNPDHRFKIGLIPRYGSSGKNETSDDVTWFELEEPLMAVHPLNAWENENEDEVIFWAPLAKSFDFSLTEGSNKYHMAEIVMNLDTKTVEMNVIDDTYNVEFSRVQDDKVGEFTRFGIASILDPTLGGDALSKGYAIFDMKEKKLHASVMYRDGDIGGEAVIIPKPNVAASDTNDVYIGTIVYNTHDEGSYFLLFDGVTNEQIARVKLPRRVPFGFHALWITNNQLRRHIEYHEKKRSES